MCEMVAFQRTDDLCFVDERLVVSQRLCGFNQVGQKCRIEKGIWIPLVPGMNALFPFNGCAWENKLARRIIALNVSLHRCRMNNHVLVNPASRSKRKKHKFGVF